MVQSQKIFGALSEKVFVDVVGAGEQLQLRSTFLGSPHSPDLILTLTVDNLHDNSQSGENKKYFACNYLILLNSSGTVRTIWTHFHFIYPQHSYSQSEGEKSRKGSLLWNIKDFVE